MVDPPLKGCGFSFGLLFSIGIDIDHSMKGIPLSLSFLRRVLD